MQLSLPSMQLPDDVDPASVCVARPPPPLRLQPLPTVHQHVRACGARHCDPTNSAHCRIQGVLVEISEDVPQVQWIRVGSLDEGAVAQLQLVRRASVLSKYATADSSLFCYGMGELWISQAIAAGPEEGEVPVAVEGGGGGKAGVGVVAM